MTKSVEHVREFWENNPLFSGESEFEPGSKEFFDEHTTVYYDDVFAGSFPEELFIPKFIYKILSRQLGFMIHFNKRKAV